jgi:predicted enzyme related to lactoylglutathione lyase
VADALTSLNNRPRWVDYAANDPQAARDFYQQLFDWSWFINDDPQYGGYAMAMIGDRSVAGFGGKQDPGMPTVWSLYFGTEDIDALTEKIREAGGGVVAEPFSVGEMGRMAVYQDPSGGFFSAWEGQGAGDWTWDTPHAFSWAELNARDVESVLPFYQQVFGWGVKNTQTMGGEQPYYEFHIGGDSILGAWEMNPMVPAEVPTYWQVYFNVDDVDATYEKALNLGASQLVEPQDFPGGRFAILNDPEGASVAIVRTAQAGQSPQDD